MNMNKILLVLIITSGFLLIIYANNDIFNRKNLFMVFQKTINGHHNQHSHNHQEDVDDDGDMVNVKALKHHHQHQRHFDNSIDDDFVAHGGDDEAGFGMEDLKRVKYIPKINATEYNIFIIYTKESQNVVLKSKFELFLKSLLKYTTVDLHLHIITDEKSELSAEVMIKSQINRYKKIVFYTLYDVEDSASKINDIVHNMLPLFNYRTGSYYSDALFLLSLGLHRIVDVNMRRAILIDCDVVFRTDVKELFDQFNKFSSENLFGLAPELTPVYRHILSKYRGNNPHTNFGNSYYLNILGSKKSNQIISLNRKRLKHGYPGLNSGVVMLDFDRIRSSKLYEENLKLESVKNMVEKYSFKGHLGDQDYYTILGYEFPGLIYRLDCVWNRQLCTWWKEHGYGDIFDTYFHCEGKIRLYHGNCNTRIPE